MNVLPPMGGMPVVNSEMPPMPIDGVGIPPPMPEGGSIPPELANELSLLLAEYEQEDGLHSVASWVCGKMHDAINVRAPFTCRMESATYAFRQQYTPEDTAKILESGQTLVHMGISAAKMSAVSAWLKDIYSGDHKVWKLNPSPVPSMPDSVAQAIAERIIQESLAMGMPPEQIGVLTDQMGAIARDHLKEAAATGAEAMEEYIHDLLTESAFAQEMALFVDDFSVYPYAVMGGPFVHSVQRVGWDGEKTVIHNETRMVSKRVNPNHLYWSADSTTTQDGEFIIEYANINASSLLACREIDGFVPAGIDMIVSRDFSFSQLSYGNHDHLDRLQKETYTTLGENQCYPVIKYFGRIPAKYLIDHGIAVKNVLLPVEVECWVVGNIVVRLVEDPYPCGKRPYFLTSFVKVPGAMVGKGLHDILEGVERVANAAARNIVRNMSYSAGPIGEVDEGRLAEGDAGINTVTPFKIYRVSESMMGTGQNPAFRFYTIPSVAGELNAVFEKFSAEADRVSGLHPMLLGQVDIASASRTASGLAMLLNNAAKVIKATIGNIDRDIVIPLVGMFYEWIMVYDETFTQKVDAYPWAQGSSHALQKDMQQAKAMELLQLLAPYSASGMVPPGTIIMLLREVLTASGYNADAMLPSVDASMMQVQNMLAGQAGGPVQKQTPPDVPQGILGGGNVPAGDSRFIQNPV